MHDNLSLGHGVPSSPAWHGQVSAPHISTSACKYSASGVGLHIPILGGFRETDFLAASYPSVPLVLCTAQEVLHHHLPYKISCPEHMSALFNPSITATSTAPSQCSPSHRSLAGASCIIPMRQPLVTSYWSPGMPLGVASPLPTQVQKSPAAREAGESQHPCPVGTALLLPRPVSCPHLSHSWE